MTNRKSGDTKESISAGQKKIFEKYPWLLGLLGSDVMLFLFFITLFNAKKSVPENDYREIRNLWIGVIAPTILLSVVATIFGVNHVGKLISSAVSIFASCWLILVIFKLNKDGYIRQKILVGHARSRLPAIVVGFIFFFMGVYMLILNNFENGYELVATNLASIFSFFVAGYLFKLAFLSSKGDAK